MNFDPAEVSQIPPKTDDDENDGPPKTLDELVEFAEEKLEEYGIADQFEVVVSNRLRRAVGKASHKGTYPTSGGYDVRKGKLKISGVWFDKFGMDRLIEEGVAEDFGKDTVLHELAHCLDYAERGTSDHSRKWKDTARRVGADPTRTCSLPDNLKKLIADWKRVCENCDYVQYYYKKPTAKRACKKCCDKHNNGRFSHKYVLKVEKVK